MSLELMGLVTALAGLFILAAPVAWAFPFMVFSTLFGAAAAISLPMLGGASILVPNLLLVFFTLRVFMATGEGYMMAALRPQSPGFWLLILTLLGIFSAIYFPRVFEGVTETMKVERVTSSRNVIALSPLRFSASNITQAVYALGGLITFAVSYAYFRHLGKPAYLVTAIIIVATADIGFAIADVVTYFTGTEYLLSFVRTANYALLTAAEKGGLKRISGTFAEASAFSEYTLVLFAIITSLWLDRVRSWATGILTALLLLSLLLSTSATALVGLAIVIPFLWIRSWISSASPFTSGRPVFLAGCLLVIPVALVSIFILFPSVGDQVNEFLDMMLLSKADSQSGKERFLWNAMAYEAFVNTFGIGAGLGSARASSFILVLLSNVGLPGFILFVVFTASILSARQPAPSENGAYIANAAMRAGKCGLIALLIGACTSGTVYDLGLLFYLIAGSIAAISLGRAPIHVPKVVHRDVRQPIDIAEPS
ncbi:hypothetical protein PDO_3156 [Rhizobium sp. PDO1-076]|uniref:hypothetical protein n=1 Tax=Rhizobium sp. PDO1-076 TaxID=1125979 RepID=UPI00024E39CE|nr:hypothetical protein [Rhizobium sp. PDO1-076]EHS49488.1 hypothetical protein PDO_3156 [Rhizobium sp. PDO1-076]